MPARHSRIVQLNFGIVAATEYQTGVQGDEVSWCLLIKDRTDRLRDIPCCWHFLASNAKGQYDRADTDLVAELKVGPARNQVPVDSSPAPAPEVFDKPDVALAQYSAMA